MAITVSNAMCTSFKQELLTATHNFTNSTGDVFKFGLLKATAGATVTADATLTNYSTITTATAELSGTGYTAGGFTLTNVTPLTSGTVAYTDFSVDPNWPSATFTSCGGFIYNSSKSNKAVATFTFSGDQTVSSGTFTVVLPNPDSTNAVLRIS